MSRHSANEPVLLWSRCSSSEKQPPMGDRPEIAAPPSAQPLPYSRLPIARPRPDPRRTPAGEFPAAPLPLPPQSGRSRAPPGRRSEVGVRARRESVAEICGAPFSTGSGSFSLSRGGGLDGRKEGEKRRRVGCDRERERGPKEGSCCCFREINNPPLQQQRAAIGARLGGFFFSCLLCFMYG